MAGLGLSHQLELLSEKGAEEPLTWSSSFTQSIPEHWQRCAFGGLSSAEQIPGEKEVGEGAAAFRAGPLLGLYAQRCS